jgi:hypothetical protein
VEASDFDEHSFFRRIHDSGARALLIGRQALIALGLPVMTRDYDYWIHIDDIALFNDALAPLGLVPTRSPEAARTSGRYVLENDEHVDVLVARAVSTVEGNRVSFDDLWARRRALDLPGGVTVLLPSLEDLIATKRFGARPKDAEDIRWLEALLREGKA